MQRWIEDVDDMKKENIGRVKTKSINTIILDSLTTKKVFNMPAKTYAQVRTELVF